MNGFHPRRLPRTGAVIEWQKSGAVIATATLPTGERIGISNYAFAANEIDSPEARVIYACTGYGASWVSSAALRRVAVAEIADIDEARRRAEIDADAVIAFAEEYRLATVDTDQDLRTREVAVQYKWDMSNGYDLEADIAKRKAARLISRADGWVRCSDSICYPIKNLREWRDPALGLALLKRGYVALFHGMSPWGAWRLADPKTATLALLADGMIELLWGVAVQAEDSLVRGRYPSDGAMAIQGGLRTMRWAIEPVRDVLAEKRKTWEAIL